MVPEGFLNDAQKQAKQDALARESGKIRKLSFSLKDASPTDISALEDVSGKPTWIPAVHAIDAITLHMLRHINASVMLQLHVPDKYAMACGGWKTDATMKRVYQETFSKERERVDRMIDDYFEDITDD